MNGYESVRSVDEAAARVGMTPFERGSLRILPPCYVIDVTETKRTSSEHRSGFVALIGRPNVGKSTLLNRLLGQKIAIVTPKPQTTRGRILGILTRPEAQLAFIDTPGLHRPRSLINKRMVLAAESAIAEADVVLWLLDVTQRLGAAEEEIAAQLKARAKKICVAVNKIDRVAATAMLPFLARLAEILPGVEMVPVSALKGRNLDVLLQQLLAMLPVGPPLYDRETFTDQTERSLVGEVIREKVLLQTRQEIPYAVAVTIDKFEDKEDKGVTVIHATIHVERQTQKGIIIGAGGQRIKEIGQAARREVESLLGRRIYLELFVRVQEEWTKDERRLRDFGL